MSRPGIELDQHDDVVIARLEGDIDLANTPTLSATILEAIPNDVLGLVVDLATCATSTAWGSACCSRSCGRCTPPVRA